MFQYLKEDFKTYRYNIGAQGFWIMLVYRFGRWRYGVRPAILREFFSLICRRCFEFIQIVAGIELHCAIGVGTQFRIDHFGGMMVSGYTRFRHNGRIRSGAVIGLENVDIGAGAKLIGKNVPIGANAVVTSAVPDNSIAVGVPAVIKARNRNQLNCV